MIIRIYTIAVFLLITNFNFCFSQNRYYLSPSVETKFGKTREALYSIPLFNYNAAFFRWDKGADVGISAGYLFNQQRTRLEIGIGTQKTVSQWGMSFNEYIPGTQTTQKKDFLILKEATGTKIPIVVSTRLLYWDSLGKSNAFSIHINLHAGLNIYRRMYMQWQYYMKESFMLSPQTQLTIEANKRISKHKHRVIPEAGISIELRKNNKEWGTFSLLTRINNFRNFNNSFSFHRQDIDFIIKDISSNKEIIYTYSALPANVFFCLNLSKKIFLSKNKKNAQ